MGSVLYPDASSLLITADGGGSNGSRVRPWKIKLQEFADETGLSISVNHFPPGTSKWNKTEHRLFSFISQNWRGKPLISHEVIVNLIQLKQAYESTVHWTQIRSQRQGVAAPTIFEIAAAKGIVLFIGHFRHHDAGPDVPGDHVPAHGVVDCIRLFISVKEDTAWPVRSGPTMRTSPDHTKINGGRPL